MSRRTRTRNVRPVGAGGRPSAAALHAEPGHAGPGHAGPQHSESGHAEPQHSESGHAEQFDAGGWLS